MRTFFLLMVLSGLSAFGSADEKTLHQYEALSAKSPEVSLTLSDADRLKVFQQVSNHPVTDLQNLGKYDPDGFIGFCFGRAMGTHLLSRKLGLAADSVRKLFILGDLRSGNDPEWRFHVTTLVKGAETNGWYAIDPIMTPPTAPGGPLTLEEWVLIVRKVWDKKGLAKLYLTSTDTIIPDVTHDPNGSTGDAIIELGFKPETKEGFTAVKFENIEVWQTDAKAEAAYFMSVAEPESDRFKFDGLVIGALTIDYKNYFGELLGDLSGEDPIVRFAPRLQAIQRILVKAFGAGSRGAPNLHSPRFDRFFPQTEVKP